MKLVVNKEVKAFTEIKNLEDLLSQLGVNNYSGMAVAVNERVIPRNDWNVCRLEEGNEITIIRAVQGG
jgi:sulfur carrier protein